MNKKGVSPLVATILLIAFAVSIGAVIMNWTATAQGIDAHEGVCDSVSLSIVQMANGPSLCVDRDAKKIRMDVENGPYPIEGLRFSYIASKSQFKDYDVRIQEGVLKHVDVDYDPAIEGEIKSIRIIPYLTEEGQKAYCTDQAQSFVGISDCNEN